MHTSAENYILENISQISVQDVVPDWTALYQRLDYHAQV